MKFSGIDLHSDNSVVAVIDEQDRRIVVKRLPNDLATILEVLAPHRQEINAVVVESTYNWYWLVDGLMAAGYRVLLANTAAIKQYEGLKYADDVTDAVHLAHLARLGLVPEGYIYPPERRSVRDLSRKRMQLVRSRTQHILALQNILARQSGATTSGATIKALTPEAIDALGWMDDITLALKANLAVIRTLDEQIAQLEARLHERIKLDGDFRLLKSAPGIGEILAMTIMLEMGTVERFERVGNFSSYCRCVDSRWSSNNKKKGSGNVKNGNRYLAWAFVEAAHYACRYCPAANRFYQRKKAKTNGIVAAKALAHKLARACYHMLREHQPFDEHRCFA